ncbi:IS1595 family transposase [Porphyrobacter sp. HT-58-2]|uniref:IS1595 family transposase n=1 Tax=Porphyrobacter sp. HT-58-2 TaxID=2023229 RepID=UPI001559C641|nr:IS1595 family transposase [Porphyrobacter sp. HT-58-2]
MQFFERFPDEDACLQHIFETKWGTHSPCPSCGQVGGWTKIKGTKKWRHRCRKHLSPLKDTVLYRSNLSLTAWFYALLLFANTSIGVRSGFIRRQLGIGHMGAYRMCRMIRVHMASMARPEMLGGEGKTVHIDEVHLRHIMHPKRGKCESAIVLGMSCDGQVLSGVVPDRTTATLIPLILERVRPGSKIITDMLPGYQKLTDYGFEHVRINHSAAFHDFAGHTNNEIEAYWSTLRRMFRASRQVQRQNLWTFLAEVEFKYNRRHAKHLIFDELISNFPPHNTSDTRALRERFEWSTHPSMPCPRD